MNKLKLVVNNRFFDKENFFIKKELKTILNLYAKKVSSGDWKDYGLSINKKENFENTLIKSIKCMPF